jgi:alpha-beta hydrolase superfamily lysophospholipase
MALANACVAAGIGYFRFDHRGCGANQGAFEQVTTLEGRVQDITAAMEIITGRTDTSDVFGFFGSSLGGTTCISAAGLTRPDAVVICAAPIRSGSIDPAKAVPEGIDNKNILLRPPALHFDIADQLSNLHDVLLFHGDADEVVPYENAGEIFALASEPKKLITLPGGDHRMTDASHQKVFVEETITWFKERLRSSHG